MVVYGNIRQLRMTTTVDVLPTIVIPKLQMMQLGTLPEEWKMAGDSERRCVLSIVERGMVLFIKASVIFTYWYGFSMFFCCT
jgi:hypothetical protein